jgi:hypothetical protein
MYNILKEAELIRGATKPPKARVFLEFKYPEIKDLLKHFLTLVSAALVFSVAFSEKIVNFETASFGQRTAVIFGWFLLIVALGSCGAGLYVLYLAAERALSEVVSGQPSDFGGIAKASSSYRILQEFYLGWDS